MLIGYARVSTADQNLDLQKDALHAAGCERLVTDAASGAKSERPGLSDALKECRKGDTLVVWKLDRLGRSLPHLVETVRDLVACGAGLKSLQENYVLAILYETEEELEHIIQEEIWAEAARITDLRNCFVEGDTISLDDPDRYW